MGFYNILEETGMTKLLKPVEFSTPHFRNLEKVMGYLESAIKNKKRVFFISDCDVDGLMSVRVMNAGLKMLGAEHLHVFQYRSRSHSLDALAVQQCIQGGYDYCIITDCGSNNFSLIRKLLRYGIKVILLDHHETTLNYEGFAEMGDIAVINTTLEEDGKALSAGGLCYCVMSEMCRRACTDERGLSVYGLVSLYADCMNMHDDLSRAIYYRATSVPTDKIPHDVTMFMNEYQVISSRFINFWFAPRINAMFRAERFDIINTLFIREAVSTTERAAVLSEMEEVYNAARELVLRVSDMITVKELETFVIGDIQSVSSQIKVNDNLLWNYTGLIANKLSDRYSKAAFVYCTYDGYVKGSVRDLFGRDFLSPFSQLCKADGHNPAFGTQIQLLDLENFLQNLERLDKKFSISETTNKPIVLNYTYSSVDSTLVEDIASINEFTSPGVPVVLLKKQRVGAMTERKTNYDYRYNWDNYIVQSQYAVGFGKWMLLRPTKGLRTKLIVQ